MITEDYVSFEVAKLLKEKGFNEKTPASYNESGEFQEGFGRWNTTPIYYSAPTFQMAMKWLRETHNIYIDISPTYSEVEKAIHFIWQIFDSNYDGIGDCEIFYSKYETACESAIKYCLENLI